MNGDNLTYWNWVLNQRKEDLSLEEVRGEDDDLIKLLKSQVEEAEEKINELENGI